MQTIKHLAVLAAVALVGANAVDATASTCSCAPFESTAAAIPTNMRSVDQFLPANCAPPAAEGVEYLCTFNKAETKASILMVGRCRYDRWGQLVCIME